MSGIADQADVTRPFCPWRLSARQHSTSSIAYCSFPDGRRFTASEAREALGTTRRTLIPLLEHLDRTGVTVRQGDLRRLA